MDEQEQAEQHDHSEVPPGEPCPTCHRKMPTKAADDSSARKRDRIVLTVPQGEEGVLDELELLVLEKYKDFWPEDAAAAAAGVGLVLAGERSWRFRLHHFALYMMATNPAFGPSEEG